MAGIMASDFRVRRGTTRHRKLRTLVARFGGAAGWAVFELWDYAVDHAPDGNLGPLTDEQLGALTSGAMLPCGAAAFGAALIEVGLVDRSADGITWVHDWLEEQGHIARLLEKREAAGLGGKESARVRRERDGSAQPKHPPKHPPKHARSTPEAPTEAGPEAEPEARPSFARAPVPDRTGPTRTYPDRTSEDSTKGSPSAPLSSPAGSDSTKPPDSTAPPKTRPIRQRTPPTGDHARLMAAWQEAFQRVTGSKPTFDVVTTSNLTRLLKAHGIESMLARIGNYEAHHKAGSFGADAFDARSFVAHVDRWAVPPKVREAPNLSRLPDLEDNAREAYEFLKRREEEDKAKAAGLLGSAHGDG